MIMRYQGPPIEEKQIDYDPSVIQEFAKRLYLKSDRIQLVYSMIGCLVSAALSAAATTDQLIIGFSIVFGIVLGNQIGAGAGLRYRIEAQQALCLAQIEKNTRPS